ncbi:Uncharacterised protein [Delftia tsuruhatensis]|nr:Uncharacterised protein [Delftia tsuruhatensis]CAC9693884.1 Uncharacterised protein [Delftia tsuruhatensis]
MAADAYALPQFQGYSQGLSVVDKTNFCETVITRENFCHIMGELSFGLRSNEGECVCVSNVVIPC